MAINLKHLSGKFKGEIEKMQVNLNDHLQHGSMVKFANEMFSAKLIPSNLHKEANFNNMMGNFRSGFSLIVTMGDLETHCCTFLDVLEKMDCDMCGRFATNLEKSWVNIFEMKASKTVLLTKLGKRYSTPSQVDDKQSSESEYRDYFRHKQKYKYSKKKNPKPVPPSLKAPESQVIPRREDGGYLYPDTAEPTTSGDDGKKVWMTAPRQKRVSSGCLPPAEIALMEKYAHTEIPSHGHRSSLSHAFYSDGIPGDPVFNRALLQHLPIRSNKQQHSTSSIPSPLAGQKMQAVSPSSTAEPLSSEPSCLPNKSISDNSTLKTQVPNSLMRGESDEKGQPYSRRRSSSIPSRFPPFTSSQSESKSEERELQGRTEMVANGSSATVSTVVSNEKIIMELLSQLQLQQGPTIGNKTQNCSNCEQLSRELQKNKILIAALEARLDEKDKQLKDQKEIISQLLKK